MLYMRVLVISDIHANLTALDAVLNEVGSFDSVWCLGDLVGYGPDPNECAEVVRKLPNLVCLIGNHDAAALGQIETDSFNPDARIALEWTREQLGPDTIAFLRNLPEQTVIDDVTLVHGSPRQPIWEYILDTRTATVNFGFFDTPFCFVGHTHLPIIYGLPENNRNARLFTPNENMQITLTPRSIINPGSVGQPRDRDQRAAFGVFDPEAKTFEFRRTSYNIAAVQKRMEEANLPAKHIHRLSAGW